VCMSLYSALTLFESSMMLGDLLLSQPLNMLALFDNAIQSVAQLLLESDDRANEDMVRLFVCQCIMFAFFIVHSQ